MRFSKPLVVTLASVALLTAPLSGAALADSAKPQPAATAQAPQPGDRSTQLTDRKSGKQDVRKQDDRNSKARAESKKRKSDVAGIAASKVAKVSASVSPGRVRAGASYTVSIVASGGSSATVTSPEGKSYRVSLSGGRGSKTLSVPAGAKAGSKTVTVKVGNKVDTASFTVVRGK
ncbi:hypothetical protein GCM10009850_089890 [Nonomuraea monospora]|uniref:Uncharacterized protein n=1 Tax=Nonomuraea monospora TaxID=568818 RepID=A0ABN3CVM3_9ACTN